MPGGAATCICDAKQKDHPCTSGWWSGTKHSEMDVVACWQNRPRVLLQLADKCTLAGCCQGREHRCVVPLSDATLRKLARAM
jgi:hypothetical protein